MMKILQLLIILTVFLSCSKEQKTQKAAQKMQEFVTNISKYSRSIKSDFIIIPQNGVELAFNNLNSEEGIHSDYFNAIDGVGVEELFFNGNYSPDNERLSMLRKLKSSKKILVSEYVTNENDIIEAFNKNINEGFVCFVRNANNYYYQNIPQTIFNENNDSISRLSEIKNFLYLIDPSKYASKQEMIQAISATNFDLVIIDLFYNNEQLSVNDVNSLKHKSNGARRLVISYINIGAAEKFRYYWQNHWRLHKPKWIKKKYQGYEDEFWVEFWNEEWQNIIYSYISKIINAGFDGAYLDNVEAYYFLYHNK
ncbi:MAG: endo alpha-1,4 polygalactosaminidase [Bacteroidales bacterium]|nr:endo alpha-1,4 polygalactosaminidase [Bacteroidales bacterium]